MPCDNGETDSSVPRAKSVGESHEARAEVESLRGNPTATYAKALHDDPAWQAANADVEQRQKDVAAADTKLADVKKSIAQRLAAAY